MATKEEPGIDSQPGTHVGDSVALARIAGMTPHERELVLLSLVCLVPAEEREQTLREMHTIAERFAVRPTSAPLH